MTLLRALAAYSGPTTAESDASAISMGLEFSVSENCQATAVYWWQPTTGASTSARTVGIYPATGTATLLGSAVASPVGSGWQRVQFSSPVNLAPGAYRATVFHPDGKYVATNYWWLAESLGGTLPGKANIVNGILTAPTGTNATSYRDQNSFAVGSSMVRPEDSFNDTSYWVDIEIDDAGGPASLDTPVITNTSKTDPTTVGASDGTITVTWSPTANADHYEAEIATGLDQTSGFSLVSASAVSPFVFSGLSAGDYTISIRAMPA